MTDRPVTRAFADFLSDRREQAGDKPELLEPMKICGKRASSSLAVSLPSLRCEKVTIGKRRFAELGGLAQSHLTFGHFDASGQATAFTLVPRAIVLDLITALLGGNSSDSPGRLSRHPTSFDARVARQVVDVWTSALVDALRNAGQTLLLPQPVLVLEPSELPADEDAPEVIGISFELTRQSATWVLEILVLATQLGIEASNLTAVVESTPDTPSLNAASDAKVRLEAVLDARDLTLEDISSIMPGDVLALADETASRVRLDASGEPLYWGTPGRRGAALVVQVDEAVFVEAGFTDVGASRLAVNAR